MAAAALERSGLVAGDMIVTATKDLPSWIAAAGARDVGFADTPLLCASEIANIGGLPRTGRLLAPTERPRLEARPAWLPAALRDDLLQ